MGKRTAHVVIVGGGSAGWLTAALLAARHDTGVPGGLRITLIESPDVPIIGVGEGTWPTMRGTLQAIGLAESDLIEHCDASYKQGSQFRGWVTGEADDAYLHPFDLPVPLSPADLVAAWRMQPPGTAFASAVSAQPAVCAAHLAPRQRAMPDFAGALNYGYHFDATKVALRLREHATKVLGVSHIRGHVTQVTRSEDGDIAAVQTREAGAIAGDLFVDCTGQSALLIGDALGVAPVDRSGALFNDRALAVQVTRPAPEEAINSTTLSTAHEAGWIWDIGLPGRRGIGCVYASDFMTDAEAERTLERYLATVPGAEGGRTEMRRIAFRSAHRASFWERNCVAIGLSAGFLEPLEASALVLIELAAGRLSAQLPANRAAMAVEARRFNALFRDHWDGIVDFLKLHYILSRRPGVYWDAHRERDSWPERLAERLALWETRPPMPGDFDRADEIFPAASYQYILYGMGFEARPHPTLKTGDPARLRQQMDAVAQRSRALMAALPTNRALLTAAGPDTRLAAQGA